MPSITHPLKRRRKARPASNVINAISTHRSVRFLLTQEYRRFAEFCRACSSDRFIGICSGPPGVGKTVAGRFYTDWDLKCRPRRLESDTLPAYFKYSRSLFYTPSVTNTPYEISRDIDEMRLRLTKQVMAAYRWEPHVQFDGRDLTELIIVDEADRLRFSSLEQLRAIFDQTGIGIVLIGMPGLAKKISRFPQLYSRVGFLHEFKTLSTADLKALLSEKSNELLQLKQHHFR